LLSVNDNGKVRQYEYDRRGYPTRTKYVDGTTEIRVPDNTGNLYETLNRSDRKYGKGGQLIKTERWEYRYDDVGNLVRLCPSRKLTGAQTLSIVTGGDGAKSSELRV